MSNEYAHSHPVADDHPVVRDGSVAMLGTQPDFHVVGQVTSENEVVEQAAALRPDVVQGCSILKGAGKWARACRRPFGQD